MVEYYFRIIQTRWRQSYQERWSTTLTHWHIFPNCKWHSNTRGQQIPSIPINISGGQFRFLALKVNNLVHNNKDLLVLSINLMKWEIFVVLLSRPQLICFNDFFLPNTWRTSRIIYDKNLGPHRQIRGSWHSKSISCFPDTMMLVVFNPFLHFSTHFDVSTTDSF